MDHPLPNCTLFGYSLQDGSQKRLTRKRQPGILLGRAGSPFWEAGTQPVSGVIKQMSTDPFKGTDQWSFGVAAQAQRSAPSRRLWIAAGLLLVMVLICFLLLQADLAFPGFYWWFIGGDLTQFWFLVLVILGIVYWRMLPRARTRRGARRSTHSGDAFRSDLPDPFSSFSTQPTRRMAPLLLLRLPLALLLVFLIAYFFFQGYTFRMNAQPTVTGDCNVGSITVVGNATADTVSLKAGLLTIEGSGNYDQASNTLNLTANMCGLTVSVPAHSNLHLSGNDAEISVTGVQGKLDLENNAGDITVNQSCLFDGSVVDNNAGTITITNSTLSPKAMVTSNDSPIHIISSPTSETCPG